MCRESVESVFIHMQAPQEFVHVDISDDKQTNRLHGLSDESKYPLVSDLRLERGWLCSEKETFMEDNIECLHVAEYNKDARYDPSSSHHSITHLKDIERRKSRRRHHKFFIRELSRIKKRDFEKMARDNPDGVSKIRLRDFDNPTERESSRRSDWHQFEAATVKENGQSKVRDDVIEFFKWQTLLKRQRVLGSMYDLKGKNASGELAPDLMPGAAEDLLIVTGAGAQGDQSLAALLTISEDHHLLAHVLVRSRRVSSSEGVLLDETSAITVELPRDEDSRAIGGPILVAGLCNPDGCPAMPPVVWCECMLVAPQPTSVHIDPGDRLVTAGSAAPGDHRQAERSVASGDRVPAARPVAPGDCLLIETINGGTVRMTTVKLLLSFQAKTNFGFTVMFKEVDLRANIDVSKNEMLYIRLPNRKLSKLKMYLSELKQTGYEWQTNLTATLTCYIEKLLKLVHCYDNNLESARPLMSDDEHVPRPDDVQRGLIECYQSMVEVLNWCLVQCICPDITYTLSRCAQKRKNPLTGDVRQFVRFFCYISGAKEVSLSFTHGSVVLWGHADSSHSGYNDAKGHMGFCFSLDELDGSFYC